MQSQTSVTGAFPLYTARGTHRELGRQHGEQAREQISAHLNSLQHSTGLATADFEQRAHRFVPLFATYCPHLLTEIEGLAEGAGISLAGALAVNIRGALGTSGSEACTAFAISREGSSSGDVLIGQNSDMLPENREYAYVLLLEPDDKPAVLMWTFGGMIGYHGLNANGVAHMANDLGAGGPARRFAMPHYPLKRMILECRVMAEVVSLFRSVPLWFNGNYVLCDGDGEILDIEATSAGPEFILDEGRGYIAHSNHYCSPVHATEKNAAGTYADSFPRLDRMNMLLSGAGDTRIGLGLLKAALADHDGYPRSICRHPSKSDGSTDFDSAGVTVAGLIAEPEQGRLHVSMGNPCASDFAAYSLAG